MSQDVQLVKGMQCRVSKGLQLVVGMRCLDACEARDLWLKSDAREGADRKSKSDASSEGARGSEAHMSTGSDTSKFITVA